MARVNHSTCLHFYFHLINMLLVYSTTGRIVLEAPRPHTQLVGHQPAAIVLESGGGYEWASPQSLSLSTSTAPLLNPDAKQQLGPPNLIFELQSEATATAPCETGVTLAEPIDALLLYTKRNSYNRNRDFKTKSVDKIRIMQLLGYYQARNDRRKHSFNIHSTPSPNQQPFFPPILHFGKLFDGSPRVKAGTNHESAARKMADDDSKRNIFISSAWNPPQIKQTQQIINQQEVKSFVQPPNGFAFTSNHWGPLGKRASNDSPIVNDTIAPL